jgi:CRP-like cAMP-binding protein
VDPLREAPVISRSRTLSRAKPVRNSFDGTGRSIENSILLGLQRKERDLLFPKMQLLDLPKHMLLHEAGAPIQYAYFINAGLVSLLTVLGDGKSVEVGLCGKEGFVGLPLLAGFITSPSRVVMQIEGSGFRISATDFQNVLRSSPKLNKSLQRFAQVLGMQATQIAACNRLHEVDHRLARWMLMSQDRIGGDVVSLTQETLSNMLGTRRASVTVAAGILQNAGLITYRRGDVKINDRHGLEQHACECYEAMKRQAARWLREAEPA